MFKTSKIGLFLGVVCVCTCGGSGCQLQWYGVGGRKNQILISLKRYVMFCSTLTLQPICICQADPATQSSCHRASGATGHYAGQCWGDALLLQQAESCAYVCMRVSKRGSFEIWVHWVVVGGGERFAHRRARARARTFWMLAHLRWKGGARPALCPSVGCARRVSCTTCQRCARGVGPPFARIAGGRLPSPDRGPAQEAPTQRPQRPAVAARTCR